MRSLFYWMIAFLVIAFIGFADAAYLTAAHYLGNLPSCTMVKGCDEVALSEYAVIGSVPVALVGAIFYAGMLTAGVAWLDTGNSFLLKLLPVVLVPAFLFSMWMVYVMFFVIDALCIFCLLSAGSTTLLMLFSLKMRLLVKG